MPLHCERCLRALPRPPAAGPAPRCPDHPSQALLDPRHPHDAALLATRHALRQRVPRALALALAALVTVLLLGVTATIRIEGWAALRLGQPIALLFVPVALAWVASLAGAAWLHRPWPPAPAAETSPVAAVSPVGAVSPVDAASSEPAPPAAVPLAAAAPRETAPAASRSRRPETQRST